VHLTRREVLKRKNNKKAQEQRAERESRTCAGGGDGGKKRNDYRGEKEGVGKHCNRSWIGLFLREKVQRKKKKGIRREKYFQDRREGSVLYPSVSQLNKVKYGEGKKY